MIPRKSELIPAMGTIIPAGKYTEIRRMKSPAKPAPPRRKPAAVGLLEWMAKEMRWGGCFQEYISREKAVMAGAIRRAAQAKWRREQMWHHLRRARGDEFRLQWELPARLVARWEQQDPDFFRDRSNLQSLRRDNPDLAYLMSLD